MIDRLTLIAPGLAKLLSYSFAEDFRHDLLAGVSVAAVALPVAIAYAQLAGFNPVVGLYSSILPLVAYAIFGTSRQMMVNPDAAVCAMVAAAVAPLAGGNGELYWSMSVAVTFLAGILCIAASFFRLGALAEFLSKPILVGLLNGVAISICLGQIGKLFGFSIESERIIPQLLEIFAKLPQTQVPTLIVGAASLFILFGLARWAPRLPAAPLILIAAGAAVALFGLDRYGVAILGPVPGGVPPLQLPRFPLEDVPSLLGSAAGLALVLFSSGMLTARSFASKGGYDIDADRELAAFGAANLASALSQGFAVTGADSRTAVAVTAGGRTQVTGLVAAVTITAVLLFLTGPLQYLPIATLGAMLIFASISLFDIQTLREIWSIDRTEVGLAAATTLGVVALGAINGILIAVALALMRFVKLTARPRDEVLGTVVGLPGLHSIERHPDAKTFPGLVLYRFDGPLTFFNSDYFKTRALAAAEAAGPELRWFVIDAIPVSQIDTTGLYALRDLRESLEARGASLILAGRKAEFLAWFQEAGLYRPEHETWIVPTLRQALKAYLRAAQRVAPPERDDL
ncbi:SulP family inorganic anion transporter [Bradyrhizobium jicamae]|uniref:SulP family inorganic anion transporter n=1 Tax=Bradyrhizobium jicamae TaxID=280332 RepID=A0ABS5FG68_9BRAD|nr:SulP family inorganic anion transporter [Bradyrhizobium jicamae]MBR0795786.1 SulP family inorganic anion transporter [Bradyrhizobium jicamae]